MAAVQSVRLYSCYSQYTWLVQVCGLDVIIFIVSATAKGGFSWNLWNPPRSATDLCIPQTYLSATWDFGAVSTKNSVALFIIQESWRCAVVIGVGVSVCVSVCASQVSTFSGTASTLCHCVHARCPLSLGQLVPHIIHNNIHLRSIKQLQRVHARCPLSLIWDSWYLVSVCASQMSTFSGTAGTSHNVPTTTCTHDWLRSIKQLQWHNQWYFPVLITCNWASLIPGIHGWRKERLVSAVCACVKLTIFHCSIILHSDVAIRHRAP